jgi:hypothetical protein
MDSVDCGPVNLTRRAAGSNVSALSDASAGRIFRLTRTARLSRAPLRDLEAGQAYALVEKWSWRNRPLQSGDEAIRVVAPPLRKSCQAARQGGCSISNWIVVRISWIASAIAWRGTCRRVNQTVSQVRRS